MLSSVDSSIVPVGRPTFVLPKDHGTRGRQIQPIDHGVVSVAKDTPFGAFAEFRQELMDSLKAGKHVVVEGAPAAARGYLKALISEFKGDEPVHYWRQNNGQHLAHQDLSHFLESVADPAKSHTLVIRAPDSTILTTKGLEKAAAECQTALEGDTQLVLLRGDKPLTGDLPDSTALISFPEADHRSIYSLARTQAFMKHAAKLGFSQDQWPELAQLFHGVRTKKIGQAAKEIAQEASDAGHAVDFKAITQVVDRYSLKRAAPGAIVPSDGKRARFEGEGEGDEAEKASSLGPERTLDEIIQLPEGVKRYVNMMKHIDAIREHIPKIKYGRNMMLSGLPGTGKTVTANAIAYEQGAIMMAPKTGDIKSKWVNEDIARLKNFFEEVRQKAAEHEPGVVVFLDEIDSLASQRGNAESGADRSRADAVNHILQEIDSFAKTEDKIFFIGATNSPHQIDPAILSRFGTHAKFQPLTKDSIRKLVWLEVSKITNCTITEDDVQKLNLPECLVKDARKVSDLALQAVLESIGRRDNDPFADPVVTVADLQKALSFVEANAPKPVVDTPPYGMYV